MKTVMKQPVINKMEILNEVCKTCIFVVLNSQNKNVSLCTKGKIAEVDLKKKKCKTKKENW